MVYEYLIAGDELIIKKLFYIKKKTSLQITAFIFSNDNVSTNLHD